MLLVGFTAGSTAKVRRPTASSNEDWLNARADVKRIAEDPRSRGLLQMSNQGYASVKSRPRWARSCG